MDNNKGGENLNQIEEEGENNKNDREWHETDIYRNKNSNHQEKLHEDNIESYYIDDSSDSLNNDSTAISIEHKNIGCYSLSDNMHNWINYAKEICTVGYLEMKKKSNEFLIHIKNQENLMLISSSLENDIISQIMQTKIQNASQEPILPLNSIASNNDWLEMIKSQSIILSKALSYRLIVKFSKSINGRKAVFEENKLRGFNLKNKRKYIDDWFDIPDECFDKIVDYLMKDEGFKNHEGILIGQSIVLSNYTDMKDFLLHYLMVWVWTLINHLDRYKDDYLIICAAVDDYLKDILSNAEELGTVLTIKSIGPLLSPSLLKTKLILLFGKKDEAQEGLIENIVIKYNQEAISLINSIQIKLRELLKSLTASIEKEKELENLQICFPDKNQANNCRLIYYIENRKSKINAKRNKVLFNSQKDYTIKIGSSTSYAIPDIKQNKIIIPKDQKK